MGGRWSVLTVCVVIDVVIQVEGGGTWSRCSVAVVHLQCAVSNMCGCGWCCRVTYCVSRDCVSVPRVVHGFAYASLIVQLVEVVWSYFGDASGEEVCLCMVVF